MVFRDELSLISLSDGSNLLIGFNFKISVSFDNSKWHFLYSTCGYFCPIVEVRLTTCMMKTTVTYELRVINLSQFLYTDAILCGACIFHVSHRLWLDETISSLDSGRFCNKSGSFHLSKLFLIKTWSSICRKRWICFVRVSG